MNQYLVLFALLILISCRDETEIPIDQLLAVPETISIQNQQLLLSTSVSRVIPDDHPIYGTCFVHAIDSTPLPPSLTMDVMWIVYNQEVWKTQLSEKHTQIVPQHITISKTFRNGPKWGPDVHVDVIVRVRYNEGSTQLLRASNQRIGGVTILLLSAFGTGKHPGLF